ncbi:MAG: TRAP transporter substrate-binding protein [Methylobacteriaceae bacterium]|nr:TRAP transporter substrate-binding protein [Rhodoblastus sp.]MCB9997908.1 TRAP transporter substrate-binding protein [Methylobacteriaceae bacterium]MCC0001962.1 TRAP transporter substrate-binding protein [Methylobacteriaceae bacterium]
MRYLVAAACAAGLAIGAFGATAPAFAADPIVLKFSHVVAPNTPKGKGADKFKELGEKYTNGKVKIEIYPNSQLYKDKEELEALQLGSVQMLAPSLAKFGPLGAKEFEVFDLPFLFPSVEALHKVQTGPIGKRLFKLLEGKGIVGLAFWDNGFKDFTSNKPVKVPDDLLGLKIRIQSSKVLEAQMKAYGAVPQVMAFSEVYQGLQTGVIDGQENTPSNIYTQKFYEVQKYGADTNHGYIGYAVIVNKKFWDGLPADVRSGLEKAMHEATEYSNSIAKTENDDAMTAMVKSGKTDFYKPTPADIKKWRAASKPVWNEMSSRIGKDLLKEVEKEVGAD